MWLQFDPDDMLSALSQPERDLFGEGSLEENQPDRLQRILDWVVSLVRGKIAAWPQNRTRMGEGDTIPEELYGDAVEIARYKFLTSFPQGKTFLDESRTALYKDAIKHLEDAAAGKLVIEPPGSTVFDPGLSNFGSMDNALGNLGFWR